ncbi:PKD domain-containing protein [Persephonella sp.]
MKGLILFLLGLASTIILSCGTENSNLSQPVSGNPEKTLIQLNLDLFKGDIQKQSNERLILKISENEVITLIRERIEKREKGFTWFGKVEGFERSSAIFTVVNDTAYGNINFGERSINISPEDTQNSIYLVKELTGLNTPMFINDYIPTPAPTKTGDTSLKAQNSNLEDGSRIDVLILYTTALKNSKGSGLNAYLQSLVDIANQSFQNSNVNTRLNLVGSVEFNSIDENLDIYTALRDLRVNSAVLNLRSQYKADVVVLIRKYTSGNICGVGYIINNLPSNFNQNLSYYINFYKDYAFSVVESGSSNGYYCPDTTFTHEVGHNLGCHHERNNASGNGAFSYSYGYNKPGVFGTIMSYAGPTIHYFSNPNVTYNGYPVGIPEGQPDSADNAKTINQTRIIVSNYIVDIPTTNNPPIINNFSAQPQTGKAPLSVTYNISVSDPDGNLLTCQLDINNDGNPEYTFNNCSNLTQTHVFNNPGTYSSILSVSDGVNTVKSSIITITVNQQNKPPVINSFNGSPTAGKAPLEVTFTFDVSDPDGDPLTCFFDFDGNNSHDYTISNCQSNSVSKTVTHQYQTPGSYDAVLTVFDGNDTVQSNPVRITVNSPNRSPIINSFTATPNSGVAPLTVDFSISVSDPDNDPLTCYIDTDNNGTDDITISNCRDNIKSYTYSTPGSYKAVLKVSDGSVTISSNLINIVVNTPNYPPVINTFSGNPSSGSAPLTVNFSYSVSDPNGDPITCRFDFDGDNNIDRTIQNCSSGTENYTFNNPGNFNSVLTVSDGRSISQKTVNITVSQPINNPPSKPIISGPATGYVGIPYSFTASSTDPEGDQITYSFSWGDGTSSGFGSKNQTKIWNQGGTYCIKAIAKDSKGNLSPQSDCHYITITNRPPTISNFSASPTSGNPPLDVTFNIQVTDPEGDQVTCHLDIDNDGINDYTLTNCRNQNITHTYNTVGLYTAKLTAVDSAGNKSSKNLTINVTQPTVNKPPDILVFKGTPPTGVEPLTVQFEYSINDPEGDTIRCKIDADNDGSPEKIINNCSSGTYQYVYNKPGEYYPMLTAEDPINNNVTVKTIYIKVLPQNQDPQINLLNVAPTDGQSPLNITITYNVSDPDGDNLTCFIDIEPDGNIDETINNCSNGQVNITINNPGNYNLLFQAQDSYGNITQKNIQIKVYPQNTNSPPDIKYFDFETDSSNTLKVKLKWEVSDKESNVLSCLLDIYNDGNTEFNIDNCYGKQEVNYEFKNPGTYQVKLTVTDGTDTVSEVLTVTVSLNNSNPEIKKFIVNPIEANVGDDVTVELSVSDPDNDPLECLIDFSDGTKELINNCMDHTLQKHYNTPGIYPIKLTVKDPHNNKVESILSVKINKGSNIFNDPSGATGCKLNSNSNSIPIYLLLLGFLTLKIILRKIKVA